MIQPRVGRAADYPGWPMPMPSTLSEGVTKLVLMNLDFIGRNVRFAFFMIQSLSFEPGTTRHQISQH